MDVALLVVRAVVGLLMTAHGAQKLFGWFGGYGLTGTGQFFDGLGFRPGRFFAALASGAEVLGGLLIALGFFGPVGPALVLSVMIVGAITVHWAHGLFSQNNGIELPLLYATIAIALALSGPGRYSADALLGLTSLWTPAVTGAALLVGIVGGFGNLALRHVGARQQVVA
jgi:putative oxidoreductase